MADSNAMNNDVYATVLTGGFGSIRGSHCPGIEALEVFTETTNTAAGANGNLSSNSSTITLAKAGVLADVPSPTWIERDGNLLYAVLEDTNEVAAFRIEHTNEANHNAVEPRLIELSRVAAQGESPTHAAVAVDDRGAKHLIVANYADGHVCVYPIAADGAVHDAAQVLAGKGRGPLPAQEGPHAHWILPLPDGRILSTDLGADRIYVHHWDSGKLVRDGAVQLAPGTGPRDMHLLPVVGGTAAHNWRVAVVGEWGNTVTLLGPVADSNSADGIHALQTVELGGDPLDQAASLAFVPWKALRAGDSATDTSGIAYVGLRGSERIMALSWNGEQLQRMAATSEPGWQGHGIDCGGSRPRHILPIGNLLLVANEVSNNVTAFVLASNGEPTVAANLPSGSPHRVHAAIAMAIRLIIVVFPWTAT
ncbi:lactonase family protein [Bifidobacterium cebidarum]|uniref:Carboxy-cis,cis-muconate cyclase n=1 Tax=Bifidobacterium cebidarum TaxID=2650773 RepID=A0A6I1GJ36_9BIFI|nr:beta-propeller fold lactonase family protein [Bifidobacterium cebidarum]KAB7787598.1 carboxy-cis,cis-muconate cyclase [Bifidobacterium cebidarum]